MEDIKDLDDIKLFVDEFYAKIRKDDLLADIFNEVIKDKWADHLDKMYRFWETVLTDERTYYGRPFPPHAPLPVDERHFARWVRLFYETIDSNFVGDKAEKAKWQGGRMAQMFLSKINQINYNQYSRMI